MKNFSNNILPIILTGLLGGILLVSMSFEWEKWMYIGLDIPTALIFLYCLLFEKKYLIGLCFFFIPFSFPLELPGGTSLNFPAELLAGILSITFLIYFFFKKGFQKLFAWSHPISIWVLLDLGIGVLTSINSEIPAVSFKRLIIKGIFVLTFFFLMIVWFQDKRRLIQSFWIFLVGLILVIAYATVRHFQYDFGIPYAPAMPKPFFDDHTIYGASIAFVLPLTGLMLLYRKTVQLKGSKLILILAIFGILLLGEFLSFSRAAWLSLVLSGILISVFILFSKIQWNRSKVIISVIVLAVGLGAGGFSLNIIFQNNKYKSVDGTTLEHVASVTNLQSNISNQERLNRWLSAMRLFKKKPVLGWGPGTYQQVYGPFQKADEMTRISTYKGNMGNAHSEYLTYLSEEGIIGLFVFLGLIITVLTIGARTYLSAIGSDKIILLGILLGLLTFFLHGFFNSFLDQIKMAGLFYPSLAAIVVMDSNKE